MKNWPVPPIIRESASMDIRSNKKIMVRSKKKNSNRNNRIQGNNMETNLPHYHRTLPTQTPNNYSSRCSSKNRASCYGSEK